MSPCCQVNRFLKWQASRLACMNQLDVIADAEALKKFQTSLRKKLWEKFGTVYDGGLPLDVTEYGTISEEKYTITKLIYQSRPGIYVTGLLYRPRKLRGKLPAVLQMHGHNPEGKFGRNPQEAALALVLKGYVCLSVDAIGVYERANTCCQVENHGNVQGGAVLNIGETLMGQQVVDNMRGIDLLRSLPFVDKKAIGAVGASGGGNQTMWLAAMDERVCAAMPIVSVGSFESYVYGMNCMCELLPDGLTFTEISGVLALIAPRFLRISNALYDCNHDFSVAEMLKSYHPVERIYWMLGLPQNISFNVADRVHGLHDRQRESLLGFFAMALKGEGSGNPIPEPEHEIYPEEKLRLFDPPSKRPKKVATLSMICRREGENLRKKMLARKSFDAAEERQRLAGLLRLPPAAEKTDLRTFAEVNDTGRYALAAGDHLIPFLLRRGTKKGVFKIVTHPEGKAFLTPELLKEAASDGSTLILPDLFGTGETAQPNHCIGLHHQFFRQLLWIGRSLVGEWVWDILTLEKMLRSRFGAKKVFLLGEKECGTASLLAEAVGNSFDKVVMIDSPASLLHDCRTVDFTEASPFTKFLNKAIYSLVLSIPGFLRWGDLILAQALCEAQIEYISPRSSDGTKLPTQEFAALQKEALRLKSKMNGTVMPS